MRLHIRCEQRLGICAEILDLLVMHNIDLRGIEIDSSGDIFLNFPNIELGEFRHLMPEIRLIQGVEDVSVISHMPKEREHEEIKTILKTLPEPVISIDSKGVIVVANQAALDVVQVSEAKIKRKKLSHWVKGFDVQEWLRPGAQCAECVHLQLKGRHFIADVYPVHVENSDSDVDFVGGVITFKSPEGIGLSYPFFNKRNSRFDGIIANSPEMYSVLKQAERMSNLEAPLLITGETGTGKEMLAKACHENSQRKDKPFLVLNCAAIPDNVAESELFGYGASAFEGAVSGKKGIIELAHEGTVFLDEIGDMSPLLQNKFLRLLQDGTYRRIGDEQEYVSDVRIICSTQKNILDLCQKGLFREDLYYRLNVLAIHIPPLRDRKADIVPMAERFIERFSVPQKRFLKISPNCRNVLMEYAWPGNVRQMENVLLRAVSLADSDLLEPDHLHLPSFEASVSYLDDNLDGTLEEMMKRFESDLLKRFFPAYPSSRQLGRKLGVSHTAIANKLREYRIGKHAQ